MNTAERLHIKKVGQSKFDEVLAKTTMVIRRDASLIGLDTIRVPLAFEAALRTTGFEKRGFSLGKTEMSGDLLAICEELLEKALDAATQKVTP